MLLIFFYVSGGSKQVSVGGNPELNVPFIYTNTYEWLL